MKCEYTHQGTGVECPGDAAFILYAHKRRKAICEPIAHRLWTLGKQPCFECRRPKWTHWDIISIHEVEATA